MPVKRYPVQIDSWHVAEGDYSIEVLVAVLQESIKKSLHFCTNPGILLSGGVDSAVLLMLTRKFIPNIPCFVFGSSPEHPDIVAAKRLEKELDLDLQKYVLDSSRVALARTLIETHFPGDEAVFLALKAVSPHVTDILATDGIDELMGGYWQHKHGPEWFKIFWDRLEKEHLTPMFESAQRAKINLHWVFLNPGVVNYIKRIPLKDRVTKRRTKCVWRELAKAVGVPKWVIKRKKLGFVNALDNFKEK